MAYNSTKEDEPSTIKYGKRRIVNSQENKSPLQEFWC